MELCGHRKIGRLKLRRNDHIRTCKKEKQVKIEEAQDRRTLRLKTRAPTPTRENAEGEEGIGMEDTCVIMTVGVRRCLAHQYKRMYFRITPLNKLLDRECHVTVRAFLLSKQRLSKCTRLNTNVHPQT